MKPPKANSVAGRAMRHSLRALVRLPDGAARRLFGEPPRNDRGAPLDKQIHIMLSVMEKSGSPKLEELGPMEAREIFKRANRTFDLAPETMHAVEERRIDGPAESIRLRVYRPRAGVLPACVFFHGGGFVIGCCDGYEGFCRALARLADCAVISVDYRLAPEHPFPAAVDDCVAAYEWISDHAEDLGVDPSCISVAGDSAGANLATVVCQQQLVMKGKLPVHQLLIYPKTDMRVERHPSRQLFSEGFFLTGSLIEWFSQCYVAGADKTDPRISPVLFEDLKSMPPAMVITAGFDPLRDEGEAYAQALRESGVDVMHRSCDELVHGFISMGGIIDAAARAIADIAEEFGRELREVKVEKKSGN